MTEAERAYAYAKRRIARAKAEGATRLDLSAAATENQPKALESLPPEIGDLTALKNLYLGGTQISDARPLAGLTALKYLQLNYTQISDLQPLRSLSKLAEAPFAPGLTFKDCAAVRQDERIAEIAGIEDPSERARTLFDYLEHWQPPGEVDEGPEIALQSDRGLKYRIGEDGRTEYDPEPVSNPSRELEDFHAILIDETDRLIALCDRNPNRMYQPLVDILTAYRAGLGASVAEMNAPQVWKKGNDLRITLGLDGVRKIDDLDEGMPPLGPDRKGGLEGLVATHNVFADLHPVLARLDRVRIDQAERLAVVENQAVIEALLGALEEQIVLMRAEIVQDLRDLFAQGAGENAAALRALGVGQESLENLIKTIVAEVAREARGESFLSKVAGDVRGAVVGAATVGLGPQVAASYPELVVVLERQIAAAMAAIHGKDYPLLQALEYYVARARRWITRDDDPD